MFGFITTILTKYVALGRPTPAGTALGTALAACVLLTACQPASNSAGNSVNGTDSTALAAPLQVQAYQLPAGQEEQITDSLRRLFSDKKTKGNASVELLPNKQLLIYADAATQQSVAGILKDIQPMPAEKTLQVTGEYWLVAGKALDGKAGDGKALVDDTVPPLSPALAPLQAVLAEINQQAGLQQFRLLERIQLTGAAQQGVEMSGDDFAVKQRIIATHPQLQSDVTIWRGETPVVKRLLESTLLADSPEQWQVIGSSGLPGSPDEYLYIIVRYRY